MDEKMKRNLQTAKVALWLLAGVSAITAACAVAEGAEKNQGAGTWRVKVFFTGGHATDPRDRGRPVGLIASALGVSPQVFRDAFSHVSPAPAGQEPAPGQVRRNKEALLSALGRYGVTNERLDEVSNYYRYNPGRGEMWPTVPAEGYALVSQGGEVIRVVITNPGAGYSSAPTISFDRGVRASTSVSVAFSKDLRKNGSITSVTVVPNRRD
jgi:hypothetical protein